MRPQVSGASWQSRTAPKAVIRADLIKIAATTKTRSTVNERPQKQRWKQQQQQQQQLKLVCTGLAASLLLCGHASAEEAAAIFAGKCIGCHVGGGNVLAAGATLFTADLERNGVATPEALYELIYAGKGRMPGFGADCAPKGKCTFGPRLSDAEVRDMATYVLQRASEDWVVQN